jgi:UDP-GlcNAc:undecaprenyl-phosphate GlcNAc-1-phosphate transferase
MGDAGALFLGVLLATLTVRFEPNSKTQIGSYLTPVFLLAVPILDTSVAVISRLRRHISPFQGGQDHLSHRLIRAGLSRKQAAISLWLLSAIYGSIAVCISRVNLAVENYLVVAGFSLWVVLFILFFNQKDS